MILSHYSAQATTGTVRAVLAQIETLAIDAAARGSEREGEAYASACRSILEAERLADRHARWIRAHCQPIEQA